MDLEAFVTKSAFICIWPIGLELYLEIVYKTHLSKLCHTIHDDLRVWPRGSPSICRWK